MRRPLPELKKGETLIVKRPCSNVSTRDVFEKIFLRRIEERIKTFSACKIERIKDGNEYKFVVKDKWKTFYKANLLIDKWTLILIESSY